MRDLSTAHVLRGDVASRHVGQWLQSAVALAPAGFDRVQDGVCLHRAGTLLYLCPAVARMLGIEGSADLVGSKVSDLIHPPDRARALAMLEAAARDGRAPPTSIALCGSLGRLVPVELSGARTGEVALPVDVLYVRACDRRDLLENEQPMPIQEGERRRGEPRRSTVLICDDEARLGALTAGLLSEYGFLPISVGTGEAALDALDGSDPGIDVLLLDVNLSAGRSAREVLTAMKDRGANARVILTSGLAEEDVDVDLVKHPSVVGYIAKPYGVDQLVQSINRALGRQ